MALQNHILVMTEDFILMVYPYSSVNNVKQSFMKMSPSLSL